MDYASLLEGIEYTGAPPRGTAAFVTQDSRKAAPGAVFVCVRGTAADGHDYAQAALDAGAGMVVTERPLGLPGEVTVENGQQAYALMCANFFGRPAQRLKLIGVSGTNGKTTVSTVLKRVLQQLGIRCGLIGTNQSEIDDMAIPAKFTTPEAWDLNALFARMVAAGCTHVVMEASSQGLAQKRLYGLRFALSIFTNLTQDHLDYHGSMRAYYLAKKILFDQSDAMLANWDDEAGRALMDEADCPVKHSYALHRGDADFVAKNLDMRADGVRFAFLGDGFLVPVQFAIPGEYSAANALAVAAAGVMLGSQPADVARALAAVKGVRGRSEVLYSGAFTVLCDFAHTADAIDKLLCALKPCVQNRLVVLFGCAGDRDAKKRPAMADAVLRYADAVFLTADNPRTEPVERTMAEVLPLLQAGGLPLQVEQDRAQAVRAALDSLGEGDMLVLCGKGHEDYQVLNGCTLFLDEHRIVAEWLEQRGLR